jgi:hypothetical protein
MKSVYSICFTFIFTSILLISCNQSNEIVPDLSSIQSSEDWILKNRDMTINETVFLNFREGDGLLWNNELVFGNASIELDIKGKNESGRSFVGLAFHGLNDSTYDVVYFRPFNFQNPERSNHSVQYISHPEHTWYKLREENPDVYENAVKPVPDPDDWFHAKIVVDYPNVSVYINHSEEPCLEVEQLSTRRKGWIGFWVGYGSDGSFRNLKITPE